MSLATTPSVFDTPRPALSEAEIAALLAEHWGLAGTLSALVGERDQNVLVDGPAGRHVLKIANAAEDARLLDLQNAALAHVAQTDPGLGVQRLVPARDGAGMVCHRGHQIRLMTWLPGRLWSATPVTPALLASLGTQLGRLSRALRGFGHPAAHRPGFLWNLDEVAALRPWAETLPEDSRALILRILDRHATRVAPRLAGLRGAVLHQDANDNNLLVAETGAEVTGIIDFGDMAWGRQINELAVALAYALLDCDDVYRSAAPLIGAYAAVFPIEPDEAEVLFDLVAARLAASVTISSRRAGADPDNAYLTISQAPALRLLDRLDRTNPAFLAAFARHAAGLAPVAAHDRVVAWLKGPDCRPKGLFDLDLTRAGRFVLSLKSGAPGMEHAGDPVAHWAWLQAEFARQRAAFAIGLYGEDRDVYKGDQFRTPASPEWRSQHLGIDIFIAAGARLHAPLPGRVVSVVDNDAPYDYGPTVILEHRAGAGGPAFWSLYGHLSRQTLDILRPGQEVAAGDLIGLVGDHDVNGGWSPHLHFQIITDRLGQSGEFPGVGQPSLWPLWSRIAPDPNLILRLAPESFITDPAPPDALAARRATVIGPSLSLSYARKLKILRGAGAWLYDHTGRAYLDAVNNIAHVGHCHPHVVAALSRQAGILNTNTRYLHDTLIAYAERLGATFADPLSVVYMVTSGSEANALALRIARTVTGRRGVVTLDWGYHGHTGELIEVSPYKFNRKGGAGRPDHVAIAALPDPYRGARKGCSAAAGRAWAADVGAAAAGLAAAGHPPAAMIAEAISGCGGQVVYPDLYLAEAAAQIRAAGGLMIVDEVQTGFGRVGDHFWAHEAQGVVPDIVTLGKPIGNGHPMAAVITTPDIARAFANGMEFFSSFGGNPVSAAVGMAVLDVIEAEGLQERARATGAYLCAGLRALAVDHPLIGDVRGRGLFLGVELVRDRDSLAPATAKAGAIANAMREAGVLVSTDGPFDNVLKIKPPLAFAIPEADLLLDALAAALRDLPAGR
ncbi:MAG: 4-aminobutyrate aminotransferase [Alphaproteobacteria bacterium HGW-Alphaproteobacteria-6]|nr:MAG: 4-aminobutyrate aminotransferase [Alphaproteobacteria bacterium HGW-Alphaproteobacteria-6]